MRSQPRILAVGEELPPLDDGEPQPHAAGCRRKAKGKSAAAGRFGVLNAFADVTLATLDRASIAVWLLLWRDTKPNGLAKTSQANLARRSGVSERSVRRALDTLVRAGLLDVVRRGRIGSGPSTYRVHPLRK
jgi:hypothetical protein